MILSGFWEILKKYKPQTNFAKIKKCWYLKKKKVGIKKKKLLDKVAEILRNISK